MFCPTFVTFKLFYQEQKYSKAMPTEHEMCRKLYIEDQGNTK